MSTATETIEGLVKQEYKYGFVTDVETDSAPPGLNEDIIRLISTKKNEPEWMLEWRLKAFSPLADDEGTHVAVRAISADQFPGHHLLLRAETERRRTQEPGRSRSRNCWRLTRNSAFRCSERERLAGVAVDAVFDSVSVGTTFKKQLAEKGIIFCSFSEAVQEHPDLVRKYLGMVVPYTDNFYAALNSAVFTDGSFCYIPKGRSLPDGTLDLFPHQRRELPASSNAR